MVNARHRYSRVHQGPKSPQPRHLSFNLFVVYQPTLAIGLLSGTDSHHLEEVAGIVDTSYTSPERDLAVKREWAVFALWKSSYSAAASPTISVLDLGGPLAPCKPSACSY